MNTLSPVSQRKGALSKPAKKAKEKVWLTIDEVNDIKIEHYFMGHKQGKEDIFNEFNKQKNIKLRRAQDASVEVINTLKTEKNIDSLGIHLKATDLFNYEAIIIVPQKDYLSESFNFLANFSYQIERKYNAEDFHLIFHFMPQSTNVNAEKLLADGYIYSYDNKK